MPRRLLAIRIIVENVFKRTVKINLLVFQALLMNCVVPTCC